MTRQGPPADQPPPAEQSKHVVAGGSTRSEKAPGYHLVPSAGLRRTAKRFDLGAERHGPFNWMKSLENEKDARAFCEEAFNHGMEHMLKMQMGLDPQDDHLGAVGWMQSVLSYVEEKFGKPWTLLDRKVVDVTTHVDSEKRWHGEHFGRTS